MKLQYYGTAAAEGIPAMFCRCETCERSRRAGGRNLRTRSQALIDGALLLDFPADTCTHALHGGLPLERINSCLITHAHSDHLYPADFEMRRVGYAYGTEGPFTFYGTRRVGELYAPVEGLCDIAEPERVRFQEIWPFEPFEVEGYRVTALAANHQPASDPVIYLIERDGEAVLYAHDTGYFPESTWAYLERTRPALDIASLDCTCGIEECADGHMGYSTVKRVRERLAGLGCVTDKTVCVVNHFSHNGHVTYDEMARTAAPDGFLVAYDGMSLDIS